MDKVTTMSLPVTVVATVAVYTILLPSEIAVPAVAELSVTVVVAKTVISSVLVSPTVAPLSSVKL